MIRQRNFLSRGLFVLWALALAFSLAGASLVPTQARASGAGEAELPLIPSADTWTGFANGGLNGRVYAAALVGSDLYVGGDFTASKDGAVTNLNYIARYHDGAWYPLAHNGVNGTVYALAVISGALYVGGNFNASGDSALLLKHIARYESSAWYELAQHGLDQAVYCLSAHGDELYLGGNFSDTVDGTPGTLKYNFIARYSSGSWYPLDGYGLDHNVWDMAWVGSDLYVAGGFDGSGMTGFTGHKIARYSPGADKFYALANTGLNDTARALAVDGTNLYVGGMFTKSYDNAVTNLNRVARYDTTAGAWAALSHNGLNDWVYDLAMYNGDLYTGGDFDKTADMGVTLNYIARYSSGAWSALARNGLNGSVSSLAPVGGDLVVGGDFGYTKDFGVALGKIGKYNHPMALMNPVYIPIVLKR